MNFCPLKRASQEAPYSPAFSSAEITLNFRELDHRADQLALELQALGIGPGSLIAVRHPTNEHLIALFFAAWRLGSSICPLHLRLPPSQVEATLQRLSPQLFITSFPWTSQKIASPYLFPSSSLFLFTSGSTGLPKIAVLSLTALLANALPAIKKFDLRPRDRWLLSLPLYHVGGIGIMIRSILAQATMVLNDRDPEITHLSWVPTQLYRSTPLYKHLRCLLLGGAPISTFPPSLPCFLSYGLTEMGSLVAAALTPSDLRSGSLLEGREVSMAPDGEILVRGSCLFQGYWKEGKLEKPFDEEGWFKTGDLGDYRAGELTLFGRKDRQFISGGENIQPEEIEQLLMKIPSVLEAIVIQRNDAEFGHLPVAFVKSLDPHFSLQQMQTALSDQLPKYKIPKTLFLVDELPKTGFNINSKHPLFP